MHPPKQKNSPEDFSQGSYDQRTDSKASYWQRQQFQKVLASYVHPGMHWLELGAGTGTDALWLTQQAIQGIKVTCTEPHPWMFAQLQNKTADVAAIHTLPLKAEQLDDLGKHVFDGAFSNFAALNCVEDLSTFAQALAAHLSAQAPVVLCLFNRQCAWELALGLIQGLSQGNPERLWRRQEHQRWVEMQPGLEVSTFYHRPQAIKQAFEPWFRLEARVGMGIATPPAGWILADRAPTFFQALHRLDMAWGKSLGLRSLGDHQIWCFTRR
jgi:Methyltransferase domain